MADVTESTQAAEPTETTISRRRFVWWFWRGLAALVVGEGAYAGLRFLASRQPESSTGQIVTAGLVSDFAPGTVTPFPAERFFLVRFPTGALLALHSKCTHLACLVGWEADRQVFACPCHGSIFGQDGGVVNPPAPRPLDYFPIAISDDNRIQVDTRKPITRSVVTGDELTYPPASADATAEPTAEATAE